MFLFYAANSAVVIASCRPRGGSDRVSFLAGILGPKCIGTDSTSPKTSLSAGIFGLISDIYILAIPLPAIRKLHLRRKKKIGVYIIFSSGALYVYTGVVSCTQLITPGPACAVSFL
jgi:hypothetical protein